MDLDKIWCVSMQGRTDLKSHSFIMLACMGMCDAIISTWTKVNVSSTLMNLLYAAKN